jgi:hypothetical protein
MIGAGRWRCSLGWMLIHAVMTTSPIIRCRLRSRIGGKRTSTLISRHLVFDSRVCVNIFKSYLPTLMTTPSNGIIFTINFTPLMNLFCRYTRVLIFFIGTHKRFAWICPVPNMMLRARHRTTLLVCPPECPRRRHCRTQDTSVLAVKFGRETHIVCLSFEGCFVGVDVFF